MDVLEHEGDTGCPYGSCGHPVILHHIPSQPKDQLPPPNTVNQHVLFFASPLHLPCASLVTGALPFLALTPFVASSLGFPESVRDVAVGQVWTGCGLGMDWLRTGCGMGFPESVWDKAVGQVRAMCVDHVRAGCGLGMLSLVEYV